MPDTTLAHIITEQVYGIKPERIISMQQHDLAWRGVFRVDEPRGSWVLRVVDAPWAEQGLAHTAALLGWLEAQEYPAPRVRPTLIGAAVGRHSDWHTLLISYTEGALLTPTPPQLCRLGETLAHLHNLSLPPISALEPATTSLESLRETQAHYDAYSERAPVHTRSLVADLRHALDDLLALEPVAALVHGDCWHFNAVETPQGSVELIDWDCAGWGHPLLDLGYALLTTHYDLAQPLVVTPNPTAIEALLAGYHAQRPLPAAYRQHLPSAVRFVLAYQFGQFLAQTPHIAENDPALAGFAARFSATAAIAELAGNCLA